MTKTKLKQKVQVVTIAQNELLLLQFAKDRGEGFQNVTGSVDPGESYLEAAKRELLEEIGVNSDVSALDFAFSFHDRWDCEVEEKAFLYHPKSKPEIIISSEHQSYKWIPVAQVKKEDFSFPTNFEAFLKALEFLA